jgi:hypothetical protein
MNSSFTRVRRHAALFAFAEKPLAELWRMGEGCFGRAVSEIVKPVLDEKKLFPLRHEFFLKKACNIGTHSHHQCLFSQPHTTFRG